MSFIGVSLYVLCTGIMCRIKKMKEKGNYDDDDDENDDDYYNYFNNLAFLDHN